MKRQALASLLPFWLLKRLANTFDTAGHYTGDTTEGHSFWLSASYRKYVRVDKRKHGWDGRND